MVFEAERVSNVWHYTQGSREIEGLALLLHYAVLERETFGLARRHRRDTGNNIISFPLKGYVQICLLLFKGNSTFAPDTHGHAALLPRKLQDEQLERTTQKWSGYHAVAEQLGRKDSVSRPGHLAWTVIHSIANWQDQTIASDSERARTAQRLNFIL